MKNACSKCNQVPEATRLLKCVTCLKLLCEGCSIRRYGNLFCSEECAKTFFFGVGDTEI